MPPIASESHLEESLQLENRRLKEQLARAERLTALGELLSTTTHEFNNILTTVLNYAKLGLRHKDTESRDKAFEKILIATQRATRITNSVLGMARNRRSDFESTDLAQIVEDAMLLLERELNKYRIQVERQFQSVPNVWANGNQIQQVLLNLIVNARQAMPGGGLVMLRLSHEPNSGMVDLTVRDTGPGIPASELPKIFEPFYSTKEVDESGKGGSGLGLSSCRDIVEAHQGRIRVESTVGKGTAFTIRIPIAQA